ncbi:MAG: protein phosphatase 2C domain-containing protein [Bacillota bacterium]|uniref:Protein phosphatase 2C domain-containing protein n=1 Tax=Virgibacillus salarius TaxID=447199 RepID=A0A941DSE1_9BACI|nr:MULTISPECIES: protein phosphatase 2C domain-containing protein [Bacillaceae]NAZ08962.1 SpoIIE family protein phosphatase [Agaribacter marinus]MBR7796254.1 protein phosphatase 2C domain-containing protein [Virgibacillus salarius]MCC2251651.1 protein phosphatase 2C domain-containing protein [Virgibacillus sp. AGTR]MDY7045163.1 protein phosphatase 2C domain-containing protein [Virgibacillus sp. M23]QRZ19684.1 protein phosphatase 2C domain-containing protein [Virgibacillus sp. AGTR]
MKRVQVSVFQRAKKGNYYCGDSYFYKETDKEFICAVADGLGSGEFAKESSQIVINIIQDNAHTSIEGIIKKCNEQLYGKRGVVVGILKLDFTTGMYSFSSIGNIGILTIVKNQKKKRNIPNAGYLAGYHRPFKIIQEKLESNMMFIMFSDGVSDRDLSEKYFLNEDVKAITQTFEYVSESNRQDDTTLIAMHYKKD